MAHVGCAPACIAEQVTLASILVSAGIGRKGSRIMLSCIACALSCQNRALIHLHSWTPTATLCHLLPIERNGIWGCRGAHTFAASCPAKHQDVVSVPSQLRKQLHSTKARPSPNCPYLAQERKHLLIWLGYTSREPSYQQTGPLKHRS